MVPMNSPKLRYSGVIDRKHIVADVKISIPGTALRAARVEVFVKLLWKLFADLDEVKLIHIDEAWDRVRKIGKTNNK
jgi:hypothetical protein